MLFCLQVRPEVLQDLLSWRAKHETYYGKTRRKTKLNALRGRGLGVGGLEQAEGDVRFINFNWRKDRNNLKSSKNELPKTLKQQKGFLDMMLYMIGLL